MMSTTATTVRRTVSAAMRPASTAERAIGSERKRSMMPFCRSSARPTEVAEVPKTIVCTMIPGIRNWA